MNAAILRNGNVVVENADADVHIAKRNGLPKWFGSFSVPHGIQFDDNEYDLELADGRTGRILISGQGITANSSTKLIRFQGTGALNPKKAV